MPKHIKKNKIFKDGVTNEVKSFLKYKVNKDKSVAKVIGLNEIEKYLKTSLLGHLSHKCNTILARNMLDHASPLTLY